MEDTYKIVIPHFYCLEYCEKGKKMTVDIDFRDKKILLNRHLISNWDKPHEKEVISIADKKKDFKNIEKELLKNNSAERIVLEDI